MTRQPHPLTIAVRRALAQAADPSRAPAMQAYMKSAMPFRGVPSPEQRRIWKALFAAYPAGSATEWRGVTLQLWRDARFREERYAAIGFADDHRYLMYRNLAALPMFEEMIVSGAWWDYVDALATHHLGDVLQSDPRRAGARMRRWARARGAGALWKRRAAILCQIRRTQATDVRLLCDCIEPNLGSPEFFIRKAIGWALRQYARTDPAAVRRFVAAHEGRLSPLSRREALRHLPGRRGAPTPAERGPGVGRPA